MEQLHTPSEIAQLSNLAHITEGIVLLIIAALVVMHGLGRLQKTWQQYLLPGIAFFASIVLIGFLFFDHIHELPRAWEWITTDMQQRQHLQMGVLLGIGSLVALVGVRQRKPKLSLALHIAIALIGFLFVIHPQHGTDAEAAKALLIHRVAGSALIFAGIAQAAALFFQQWRKVLLVSAGVALALSAVLFTAYREPATHGEMSAQTQNTSNYSLDLLSGAKYQARQPVLLRFALREGGGTALKEYDSVDEHRLHLIVIRKDRTNFQHVHPQFDQATGEFSLENFSLPTDGEYRMYADFTPADAPLGQGGLKSASLVSTDIVVGSGKYESQGPAKTEKLSANVQGLTTKLTVVDHGGGTAKAYATIPVALGVAIEKNNVPYKSLQPQSGSLGHMVVIGPDLEYIRAYPQDDSTAPQIGMIAFMVTFPTSGMYTVYLQTQAEGHINTTDYVYSVGQVPTDGQSQHTNMEGMGH